MRLTAEIPKEQLVLRTPAFFIFPNLAIQILALFKKVKPNGVR